MIKNRPEKNLLDKLPEKLRNRIIRIVFPFLTAYDSNGKVQKKTFWTSIPEAWRNRFGIEMCREISKELRRCERKDVRALCIKEKFGVIDVTLTSYPGKILDILRKYIQISAKVCYKCGGDADGHTVSWPYPVCRECFEAMDDKSRCQLGFKFDINNPLEYDNDEYDYGHNVPRHPIHGEYD